MLASTTENGAAAAGVAGVGGGAAHADTAAAHRMTDINRAAIMRPRYLSLRVLRGNTSTVSPITIVIKS